MKPYLLAHRGGDCFGPENSQQAIEASLKYKMDIIEIDVRESSDGILFCYHGNVSEFLFARFYFKKPYKLLKEKYSSLLTLSEALALIQDKAILFIDVKDNNINPSKLITQIKQGKSNQVYIASQSLDFLKKMGSLPKTWRKVCNGGILFLKLKLHELLASDIDIIELWWWDYSKKNRVLLKSHDISTALARWLFPRKKYITTCFSTESHWVSDYDIPKLKEAYP